MLPWHNVPNSYNAIEEQGIDTFKTLKKKQKPLFKKGIDGSLLAQLKQNLKYLMSPVYLGTVLGMPGNTASSTAERRTVTCIKNLSSYHNNVYHGKFQYDIVSEPP